MFWLFQKENEDQAKENFLSTLNGRVFITCFCPIDLHSVLKEAKLVIKMKHINETRWLQDYQWNPSKLTDDPALIIELLLIKEDGLSIKGHFTDMCTDTILRLRLLLEHTNKCSLMK